MGRLLCTGVLEGLGAGELTFEVGLNGSIGLRWR
jgi:hypothetical protein